jgi:hypothetical protein
VPQEVKADFTKLDKNYSNLMSKYSNNITIRNKNPLNLRPQNGKGFRTFSTFAEGYNAGISDLTTKVTGRSNAMKNVYGEDYLDNATLLDMIEVFAPASDNNYPVAYANTVAKRLNIKPSTKLSTLKNSIPQLMDAMMYVENNQLYKELYG